METPYKSAKRHKSEQRDCFFFFFLDICYAFNKDLARFQAYLFVKAELKAKALKVVRKTV